MVSVEEVMERIERAAKAAPHGVVAFDGDGTLWSGDIGDDLFAALIEHDAFLEMTAVPLGNEARAFGIAAGAKPSETARALAAAYVAGDYPEEHMVELTAWGLAGRTSDDVMAFASQVVTSRKLVARLQRETVTIVEHARRLGLSVHVVSASPRGIVTAAAALVGIEASHVIAASAIDAGGRMTTQLDRPVPYGKGKIIRLREAIGNRQLVAAFGDNDFDADMLRAASVPVAVRPKARLRQVAASIPGLVELQPR